jgi:FG-GAP repeat/Abnormal spindle-like microcephaly-assoc'd, ASPM-SPD-2-Hydin
MKKLRALGLLVSLLVLLVILMLVPPAALAQQAASLRSAHVDPAPSAGLSSLSSGAQGPISAALGKDDSAYWIHAIAGGLRGENPRQALTTDFTKQGAEVRSHDLRWSLEARSFGYGDALGPLKAVAPQAKVNHVEYRRDGVTEWYENGPLGLEQGFTLAHRPTKATEKKNTQPLTLELVLHGDLIAAFDPGGKTLELREKKGKPALRYTGLTARDATGRELQSWLELKGDRLQVRVDDAEARYPVVIDPWIQQAELTASDGAADDYFGSSIAVSGSTVVVGAPSLFAQGAAYVFVESGGTWSQQAELIASDGAAKDQFGDSVSVSGSTIVVGARLHQVGSNVAQGAVYVFFGTGGTWSQQAELTASNGAADDQFGWSVAASGSTVVVGTPYHISPQGEPLGAAYVFAESGGTWSQQAELATADPGADNNIGWSVAISGSTIVATGIDTYLGQLAAFVFAQNGTTWSEQVELSELDSGITAVAVDGSTIVLGDTYAGPNIQQGAAYVFVESGGTWSQQAMLTASDGAAFDHFGSSVAVSGSTVVVGSPNGGDSNSMFGAAYVFVESGGAWSQQAELIASDEAPDDSFGGCVAVSGSALVVGAPNHTVGSNIFQGAAYGFGSSGPLYTLSAAPSSLSVGQGGQGTSTFTITPWDGFSGSVLFSILGLPSGVTAAFDPNPATSATTLTVTPSGKAAANTSEFFVFGTSGSLVQDAPLVLTVMAAPVVTLSSTSLNFGDEAISGTSGAKAVTVENTGTVTLDISNIGASAEFEISGNTCGATLAARKTCKVSVTFAPTQFGAVTGTLTFTDNALSSPQTVTLSGTGIAQAALTPASYTFKETRVGDTSYVHKFTLRNNLPTTLTDISYSTTGPFAVSASTCGTNLNSKATCTISVTFSPTQTGTASGTLSVTDSANNSPQTSSMTGSGD